MIELKDACVAVRAPGGEIHLHQAMPLAGKLSGYSSRDDFIKELGSTIKPNSSALFLLVQKVTADKVLLRTAEFKGRVLKTSRSEEREQRLREALDDTAAGPA